MIFFRLFFLFLLFFQLTLFGASAYQHTEKILSYGPRPSGSKNIKLVQNYIIQLAKQNQFQVDITQQKLKTPLGELAFKNIAAKKEGSSGKYIVIAAHYESKYFEKQKFLGANDSASAVGILLELMEEVYEKQQKYGIIFLFLDGEEAFLSWSDEDSLYGSRMQSKIWQENKFAPLIHSFILLDMVGDEKTSFCREENFDPELNRIFWKLAQQNQFNYFKDCSVSVSDDHFPFKKIGIKTIDIIAYPFPHYWHKESDNLEKVSPKRLFEIKKMILDYLSLMNENSFSFQQ